jgi:hypothetical protein
LRADEKRRPRLYTGKGEEKEDIYILFLKFDKVSIYLSDLNTKVLRLLSYLVE